MCIIKKNNMELKRMLVSNHCVAGMADIGLVDMCLFSGEGKPTLLGGYAISQDEAMSLGRALINSGHTLKRNLSSDEKVKIIRENIIFIYNLMKDVDAEKAKELERIFDIKKVEMKKQEQAGYIG